jgi:hypothetical protein
MEMGGHEAVGPRLEPVTLGSLKETLKAGLYYVCAVEQWKPSISGEDYVICVGPRVVEGREAWCELAAVRGRT